MMLLGAIVMNSASSTVSYASLAVFTCEFSDYSDDVLIKANTLRQQLAINGDIVNDAQLYYMVANGLTSPNVDEIKNYKVPEGYIIYDEIYGKLTNATKEDDQVVAYLIKDDTIGSSYSSTYLDEYASKKFITSDGTVFTLPGYPYECTDGTIQYYMGASRRANYVTKGKSNLSVGDLNVNGDEVSKNEEIDLQDFMRDTFGVENELSNNETNYQNVVEVTPAPSIKKYGTPNYFISIRQ